MCCPVFCGYVYSSDAFWFLSHLTSIVLHYNIVLQRVWPGTTLFSSFLSVTPCIWIKRTNLVIYTVKMGDGFTSSLGLPDRHYIFPVNFLVKCDNIHLLWACHEEWLKFAGFLGSCCGCCFQTSFVITAIQVEILSIWSNDGVLWKNTHWDIMSSQNLYETGWSSIVLVARLGIVFIHLTLLRCSYTGLVQRATGVHLLLLSRNFIQPWAALPKFFPNHNMPTSRPFLCSQHEQNSMPNQCLSFLSKAYLLACIIILSIQFVWNCSVICFCHNLNSV